MKTNFFAEQGRNYTKSRPLYPDELFKYLAGRCSCHELAWDCATGTGQAAIGLAKRFDQVVATDISADQIQNAPRIANVQYGVGAAETYVLSPHSIDLIVVAQAAHWLNLNLFFQNCANVGKPGGIIAAFGFREVSVSEGVDLILSQYFEIIKNYWPLSSLTVNDSKYQSIECPFDEISVPEFRISLCWNMKHVVALLDSYSGARAFLKETGHLPSREVEQVLREAWGPTGDELRMVSIPLSFRAWRLTKTSS